MYAVIELAGKQHKVEKGRWFLTEQPEDAPLEPRVLMVVDGKKTVVGEDAAKASVKLSTTGTVRERYERSMRFKPKQGRTSKRMLGHRRTMTKVMVDGISL